MKKNKLSTSARPRKLSELLADEAMNVNGGQRVLGLTANPNAPTPTHHHHHHHKSQPSAPLFGLTTI